LIFIYPPKLLVRASRYGMLELRSLSPIFPDEMDALKPQLL